MTFQLWMADVLRDAGLSVVEVPGWRTRTAMESGRPRAFAPRGLIIHETRGALNSTDAGEINVMINGREGLSGPIAHLYLSRTGTWHVVTAGASNHVKTGWAGPFDGLGNTHLLGIEAQHAAGELWTDRQYLSYVRGVAALNRFTRWQIVGHKEHQPGDKPDPAFNMETFRADVAAVLNGDNYMGFNLPAGVPTPNAYSGKTADMLEIDLHAQEYAGRSAWDGHETPRSRMIRETHEAVTTGIPVTLQPEDRAAIVADLAAALEPKLAAAVESVLERARMVVS